MDKELLIQGVKKETDNENTTTQTYPEWITDRMPPETKQTSDTLQGHREWTESERVLAYDSSYGCCIDATRNGKWMSETRGGYQGQICHRIIAWMPLPPPPLTEECQ